MLNSGASRLWLFLHFSVFATTSHILTTLLLDTLKFKTLTVFAPTPEMIQKPLWALRNKNMKVKKATLVYEIFIILHWGG